MLFKKHSNSPIRICDAVAGVTLCVLGLLDIGQSASSVFKVAASAGVGRLFIGSVALGLGLLTIRFAPGYETSRFLYELVSPLLKAFPRPKHIASILEFLGRAFPPEARETVWELPISDVIRDFQHSYSKLRSVPALIWLYARFVLLIAIALFEATRVCVVERAASLIRPLVRFFVGR